MAKGDYDRKREAERQRQAAQSAEGRDIGAVPKAAHPRRKRACRADFRRFCLTYLPQTYLLPFCPDHLKVIGRIEESVLRGGLFALAMPRGSGKTTLCESAALWAILYGHRDFVCLVANDASAACRMLDSIKAEVETNELLAEDFPEVCYPIERLERIVNRCKGQTCGGEPTYITWTADEIVLPTVPRSPAAGAVVKVAGITGSIRGMKFKRPDGRSVRPSLVIVDDPQTDESANSVSQCETRERILAGAVLGLAGPGRKISGIMPCTVIRPGDMADRILDRTIHPEWNGERTKLVYSFPADEKLWDRYAELRAESLRAGNRGQEATDFYAAHREAMDAGAAVAWPERYNPDELSAIQHAMNLKLQDAQAFYAEYQNEPLPLTPTDSTELTPGAVAERVNNHERGVAPARATRLTAFVDVQQALLYWCVCAWEEDFTGAVLAYGAYPDQQRAYYQLRDARPTLQDAHPVGGLEGQLYAGLQALTLDLLGREWRLDGAGGLKVERCLVDANWGQSTDVVYRFCRQSPHSAVLTPSHGKGITASANPIGDWPKKPGERRGLNWIQPAPQPGRPRRILYDVNWWKSFAAQRLLVPVGSRGALTLHGGKPMAHRLLADHLCSEYRVRTEGRGRQVDEWKIRPHRPDNHLWDCLVGCCVAASTLGVSLADPGGAAPSPRAGERRRVSYAEMQARARAGAKA